MLKKIRAGSPKRATRSSGITNGSSAATASRIESAGVERLRQRLADLGRVAAEQRLAAGRRRSQTATGSSSWASQVSSFDGTSGMSQAIATTPRPRARASAVTTPVSG